MPGSDAGTRSITTTSGGRSLRSSRAIPILAPIPAAIRAGRRFARRRIIPSIPARMRASRRPRLTRLPVTEARIRRDDENEEDRHRHYRSSTARIGSAVEPLPPSIGVLWRYRRGCKIDVRRLGVAALDARAVGVTLDQEPL